MRTPQKHKIIGVFKDAPCAPDPVAIEAAAEIYCRALYRFYEERQRKDHGTSLDILPTLH